MMSELPGELTVKPLALVAITGLNTTNQIHRSIWDTFINNRRSDNIVIQYKLLSNNHEFPTVKPKRNSYEWYIPKGILKRNWMNKYLNEVPAVCVIFYDLDWSDPSWNDKKMECVSRLHALRAALEGRNTRIALVLIQKYVPPPGTEDVLATERATALHTACEIPAKSLYILPYGDHLIGYITRLEGAFNDLAQGFYHYQYRIVKGHRELLNKMTHQYLFVRHQFKMGFFNELKHEQQIAYKHYQQAYNNLLDIRMVDTNSLEIKTVASFINYKLCRLMFLLNLPKDAISQFKNHVDRFKVKTGPKELIFEHHAWMSSQYSTFAELFYEAIRQGLPAVQTQHPGYYFQMAAKYASQRQAACKEICSSVNSHPEPDPLAGEERLEFYGQRPWRPGKLSAEPTDILGETAAIQALQFKEKTRVNHSMIIIGLLGNAISQFKVHKCPRMRRVLVIKMAEEYFNVKDYGKVLTLLMHMLWEYRNERWPLILTNILRIALRAAYLSASVQDYLALSLEALGPFNTFTDQDRSFIYSNICNIIEKKLPKPEADLLINDEKSTIEKWNAEFNHSEPILYTMDDNNAASFLEVKAKFTKEEYIVNSTISIIIIVRNSYRGKIQFSKLSALISSLGHSRELTISENPDLLTFNGKEEKIYEFEFQTPEQNDESEIKITALSLYLGRENYCCVILRFPANGGTETNYLDRSNSDLQELRGTKFDLMKPLINARIKQEKSRVILKIQSKEPALLGEWLPIKIEISVQQKISKGCLKVLLISDGTNEHSTELSLDTKEKQVNLSIDVTSIEENCTVEKIIYIRAHKIGNRSLNIKFDYLRSEQEKGLTIIKYSISVVKAFEISTQFYTMLYEPLTKAFINEPFYLMPHITCTSPWPIEIIDTSIELGEFIQKESKTHENSILAGTIISEREAGTDVYCLFPKIGSEQPTSTGIYTVKWKRANCQDSMETSNSVTLTPIWVEDSIIGVQAELPAHGWVRTPLCVTYYIRNHSEYFITLHMTMEASDAFMFAGNKQVNICILPESERKVEWILRPLVSGFVALPILTLSVPPEEEYKLNKNRLAEVLERSLPTHIYIIPKSQNSEE